MHNSNHHDFDFLMGTWNVHHRRLKTRLAGDDTWQTFTGTCIAQPMLGGAGNVDDNVLHHPDGSYRALAVRSFDTATKLWAIWWLDARHPHQLDAPVVGVFEDGVGSFYADDAFNGQPIRVRFQWRDTQTGSPAWEQAFSVDGGNTWEVNWKMRFERAVQA
jgi:hypothetical protein